MFNKYFQDEISYLRELGREFANAYPALAPMLADRGGDPDVERLLEGVAFLTGRIRQRLDDEFPEFIHGLASLLFPHLIRPLPAASIVELSPIPSVLQERAEVPIGTEFLSVEVSGTACRFQSRWACTLVPWAIEDVRLELLPRGRQQLRVAFRTLAGQKAGEIAPELTRLHLHGDHRSSLGLLMWMQERLEDVVLLDESVGREISLGKRAVRPAGFAEDEALLPFGRMAFPGFRLLAEYYALPEKFAFIDVEGLKRTQEFGKDTFVLAFRFEAPFPHPPGDISNAVKLHCVPVLNIFEASADPLRLTPGREQFLVRPAGLQPGHGSVYAIRNVQMILRETNERVAIPSFFEFSHSEQAADRNRTFYTMHLNHGVIGDGVDVALSFGTPEDASVLPDADLVSVDLIATNGSLADAVRAGEIRVPSFNSPVSATFRNLFAVTKHVAAPIGRELQWRVVAHTAMGLRSITEIEVLRAALDVYNLHALVDRQAARANELRLAAVVAVRVKPAERLFRGSLVRGVAIEVDLNESGFAGEGDMYVFAAMLDHMFANYVSINSFSTTTAIGINSRIKFSWPARSGNQMLL